MNKGTLASAHKKYSLFRRWQVTSGQDYLQYVKARNLARKECRKAQRQTEQRLASEAKSNPNNIWKYTKSKTASRSGIPNLQKTDGSKAKSDKEKAEALNDFFKSVFTIEAPGPTPEPPRYNFKATLKTIEVKVEDVEKLLSNLIHGKSAGPDGIPPQILSIAAKELAIPLRNLFQLSLNTGKLPLEWKKANVSPIHKKGPRTTPNNYRPVSLTSVTCKVMEKLVRKAVMTHLEENEIISKDQHGFISGRSCTTHLLETLDTWTEILDEGGSIDVVYTDFQKAFDSVPHNRLVEKVAACGINGDLKDWIKDFLSNRTQSVVVNGTRSQEGKVTSGIPQGSVLGPILFVIYINDLPNCTTNQVKMFADDTKIFSRSDVHGNEASLQKDLDELVKWSEKWQLKFHPEKCALMKLGPRTDTEYYMTSKDKNGNETCIKIQEKEAEKDLGVFVDNSLSFKHHVEKAKLKANRVMGLIRRSFDYLSEEMFVQLFKALVRPILEYGHSVWNLDIATRKGLCAQLESVQRAATRMLAHPNHLSYHRRLEKLKLPSLEHRRIRGGMIKPMLPGTPYSTLC